MLSPNQAGTPSASSAGNANQLQSPQLKYSANIQKIDGCPPVECVSVDCQPYRFAFAKIDNRAFTPVALINPQRTLRGRPVAQCCTCYSLSVFQTFEQLKARALEGLKNSPQFLKKIGDHFIRMDIRSVDGACTTPTGTGHFDFFEFATFDGPDSVREHGKLMP